jgi:hypothetical protein
LPVRKVSSAARLEPSTTATLTAGLATGSFWLNVLEGLPDALPESCLAPAMVARIDILPGTEASRQGPP